MYSTDLKERAISLYYKLKSYRRASYFINVSKSTIQRWVCEYENKNIIVDEKSLDNFDDIANFIKNLFKKDKFITITQITEKINKKFNKNISRTLIYLIIKKKLNYSYKKVTDRLKPKNKTKLTYLIKKFQKDLKSIDKNKIICIDETYLQSNIHPNYAWGLKGKEIIHKTKSNPQKLSIIMAVSNNKILDYKVQKENFNSFNFREFIKILTSKYNGYYFLMDNVAFHKSKHTIDIINNTKNNILFIPPYSPQFNPIEHLFAQFKNTVRKYLLKKNSVYNIKNIEKIISKISPSYLKNYYKHSFGERPK